MSVERGLGGVGAQMCYARGRGPKCAWRDVLDSLEDDAARPKTGTGTPDR